MNESQLFQAARTMRSMGSFASAISEAYFVADAWNRETLVQAFKGLFERALEQSSINQQG
jgi:predicted dinucleotide-binding enzyme